MAVRRVLVSLRLILISLSCIPVLLIFLIGSVVQGGSRTGNAAAAKAPSSAPAEAAGKVRPGYYRFPAIHGDTIVFTAEGDLWVVSAKGGAARRLTSNPGEETGAVVSSDGQTVAFSAEYEGPTEVYTMPIDGDCRSGGPGKETWRRDGRRTAGCW